MLKQVLNNSIDSLMLTYQSFFLSTFAVFKECSKPKRIPDYISYDKKRNISSNYWYGTNRLGDYVIRESNHWSSFIDSKNTTAVKGCGNIGKTNCFWSIKLSLSKIKDKKQYTAKAYFKTFKDLTNDVH